MVWRCIHIKDVSEKQLQCCLQWMESDRRAQVERLSNTQMRLSSICGEWLTKTMLSEISGIAAEEISLVRDKRGKPYVKNLPLYFSVSHSGDFVACAVSDRPIGLDLEQVRQCDISAAKRICSPKELEYILTAEDSLTRFFRVWTAKEAYVKMTGEGIAGMRKADFFSLGPALSVQEKNGCIITICCP